MFETIKARYLKNYVRDDQLARYVKLGAITQVEADAIIAAKAQKGLGDTV